MGILFIPRTMSAIARGYYRAKRSPLPKEKLANIGLSVKNPHIYEGRSGLLDTDIMGHMNNAAYLTHAELARWDMSGMNGTLATCYRENILFFVTGTAVRYRKEIKPFKKFHVESYIASIDNRNAWYYHTFHYPGENKVLAQILVQAVLYDQKKKVVLPMEDFFKLHNPDEDKSELMEELLHSSHCDLMKQKTSRFQQLEEVLRESAALDDARKISKR